MCYDDSARPPSPPGATGEAHGEEIVLTSADGNRFLAFVGHPAKPGKAQMIIYPDVRGLFQFYKDLALRFAEVGITAIAVDYFGRSAGMTSRDESFEFMPHVMQMTLDTFSQDARAALDYLHKQQPGASVFTVGFCMGGSLSFFTSMDTSFGFAGVIGFYAGMSRGFGGGTILERAEEVKYPALGLFGGADQGIPAENVKLLDEKLDKTGQEHTIVIYDGAPHSFFDRRASDYAEASADSWKRILAFVQQHTK
jgi:carboxymethylenebutenolidase